MPVLRPFLFRVAVMAGLLALAGCQAPFDAEPLAPAAMPLPEPIALTHRPFGPVTYRLRISGPQGRVSVVQDLRMTATAAGRQLAFTIDEIGYSAPTIAGGQYQSSHLPIRLLADTSGQIVDLVARTKDGIRSADDPTVSNQWRTNFQFMLPIYPPGAITTGLTAARTATVTTPKGDLHFTMTLAGGLLYHGADAVRLDFDQIIADRRVGPDLNPTERARGYMIVDRANGSVMRSVYLPGDGSEWSVELL